MQTWLGAIQNTYNLLQDKSNRNLEEHYVNLLFYLFN